MSIRVHLRGRRLLRVDAAGRRDGAWPARGSLAVRQVPKRRRSHVRSPRDSAPRCAAGPLARHRAPRRLRGLRPPWPRSHSRRRARLAGVDRARCVAPRRDGSSDLGDDGRRPLRPRRRWQFPRLATASTTARDDARRPRAQSRNRSIDRASRSPTTRCTVDAGSRTVYWLERGAGTRASRCWPDLVRREAARGRRRPRTATRRSRPQALPALRCVAISATPRRTRARGIRRSRPNPRGCAATPRSGSARRAARLAPP